MATSLLAFYILKTQKECKFRPRIWRSVDYLINYRNIYKSADVQVKPHPYNIHGIKKIFE